MRGKQEVVADVTCMCMHTHTHLLGLKMYFQSRYILTCLSPFQLLIDKHGPSGAPFRQVVTLHGEAASVQSCPAAVLQQQAESAGGLGEWGQGQGAAGACSRNRWAAGW